MDAERLPIRTRTEMRLHICCRGVQDARVAREAHRTRHVHVVQRHVRARDRGTARQQTGFERSQANVLKRETRHVRQRNRRVARLLICRLDIDCNFCESTNAVVKLPMRVSAFTDEQTHGAITVNSQCHACSLLAVCLS